MLLNLLSIMKITVIRLGWDIALEKVGSVVDFVDCRTRSKSIEVYETKWTQLHLCRIVTKEIQWSVEYVLWILFRMQLKSFWTSCSVTPSEVFNILPDV